jgi:hypothetical protein
MLMSQRVASLFRKAQLILLADSRPVVRRASQRGIIPLTLTA